MSFTSVVILLGALQGFFLFVTLSGMKRGNREANTVAGFFILFISITLLGRYAYTITTSSLFMSKLLFVGDFVIFFYGPLLYFYFIRLFKSEPTVRIRTWMHFIPLLIFAIIILPIIIFDQQEFIDYSSRMEIVFYGLEFFAICQNYFYLYVNIGLIRSFQRNSLQVSSVIPQIWFYKILLGTTFVGLFFWSASFAMRFIGPEELRGFLGYQLVWISLSVLIIGLGYVILNNPEVFVPIMVTTETTPPAKPAPIENFQELSDTLNRTMKEQRPYLEPRLSLPELAERSKIPVHTLSRVINEGFGKNFFEFVNTYRVEEFKRLATPEKLKHHTVFALALESGFNSKTTFNAAFKKITSLTPREYLNSLQQSAV